MRWERRSPGPRTRRSISPSKWSRFCCRTTRRASVFRQVILKPSYIHSPPFELQMCPNCRPTSTWLAWISHSRCAPTPNTCRRRARSPSSRPGSLSSRRWTQSSPSSTRRCVRVRVRNYLPLQLSMCTKFYFNTIGENNNCIFDFAGSGTDRSPGYRAEGRHASIHVPHHKRPRKRRGK